MKTISAMIGIIGVLAILLIVNVPQDSFAAPAIGDKGNFYKDSTKIAEYYLNEGSGDTIRDDSGRGKTGTRYGAGWYAGRDDSSSALRFIGSSGNYRVQVSDDDDFDVGSNFAMTAIIRATDTSETYHIIASKYYYSGGSSWGFNFYLTNGNLRFTAYAGATYKNIQDTDGDDLRDGEWHFVAVRKYGTSYELIVDGGVVETATSSIYPGTNSQPFYIGYASISASTRFDGDIDHVSIFEIDSSLSYNTPWYASSVGYWEFDEGDGSYANDRANRHENDRGTRSGPLWTSTSKVGAYALDFDGNNDYVTVGHDSKQNPSFTTGMYIECWFKCEDVDQMDRQTLLAKYYQNPNDLDDSHGYKLFISSKKMRFQTFSTSNFNVMGDVNLNDNTWYHVWAWWQLGGKLNFRVEDQNGNLVDEEESANAVTSIPSTTAPIYFGKTQYASGGYDYFEGIIDNMVLRRE